MEMDDIYKDKDGYTVDPVQNLDKIYYLIIIIIKNLILFISRKDCI